MQSVLVDDEGVTPDGFSSIRTLPKEGEQSNLYANEEERQLYTFLLNNNIIMLYDTLKSSGLYIDQLQNINLNHPTDFDNLCSNTCLALTDKPHIKIRLKTAIQSLQNERAPIAPLDIAPYHQNIRAPQHAYPSPMRSLPQHPLQPGFNENIIEQFNEFNHPGADVDNVDNDKEQKILDHMHDHIPGAQPQPQIPHIYPSPNIVKRNIINYLPYIEDNDHQPLIITDVINSAYRVMILLRIILWIMDEFLLQSTIKSKSIVIGGRLGSSLLCMMSIRGMYGICQNPISKKSGSLSMILAVTEVIYFICRNGLSFVAHDFLYAQDTYDDSMLQYSFGIHSMLSILLGCCLGRIIWQYRSEMFAQLHINYFYITFNYLMLVWVMNWELNSLHAIVFENNEKGVPGIVETYHNLMTVAFCTEIAFCLGVVFTAPRFNKLKQD